MSVANIHRNEVEMNSLDRLLPIQWNKVVRISSSDYHASFHLELIGYPMKCICYESLSPDCPSCSKLDPVTYASRLVIRQRLLKNAGDKNFYGDILSTEDCVLGVLEPASQPRR